MARSSDKIECRIEWRDRVAGSNGGLGCRIRWQAGANGGIRPLDRWSDLHREIAGEGISLKRETERPENRPDGPAFKLQSVEEAYFTVEAALVVPVVICIFVMLIYLSFYLYDRCVLAQDCYVLSCRQSMEKGEADRAGTEAAKEQFGQKLFMLSRLETSASKGSKVQVTANASMKAPLFGLDIFEKERTWNLGVKAAARKTDPPAAYRKVRRILNLASGALSSDREGMP